MCGRYYIDSKTESDIWKIVGYVSEKIKRGTSRDVFPSDTAVVITGRNHKLTVESMKWGFPLQDSSQLVLNAKSETALDKRSFSNSILRRRCVIPAAHFYEWDKDRNKAVFSNLDHQSLYMAGFYDCVNNEDRFVILTTSANESMKPVHDRMPLIVPEQEINHWIYHEEMTKEILKWKSPLLHRTQEYEQLSLF